MMKGKPFTSTFNIFGLIFKYEKASSAAVFAANPYYL
jgi:hypothetical protein